MRTGHGSGHWTVRDLPTGNSKMGGSVSALAFQWSSAAMYRGSPEALTGLAPPISQDWMLHVAWKPEALLIVKPYTLIVWPMVPTMTSAAPVSRSGSVSTYAGTMP